MKQKWEPNSIKVNFIVTQKKEEELKRLEEIAEAMIEYFSQLTKTDSIAKATVTLSSDQRRTGTDG